MMEEAAPQVHDAAFCLGFGRTYTSPDPPARLYVYRFPLRSQHAHAAASTLAVPDLSSCPSCLQFVSGASMRAPEEVFASEAAGAPRAEEELSREDRQRQRAQVGNVCAHGKGRASHAITQIVTNCWKHMWPEQVSAFNRCAGRSWGLLCRTACRCVPKFVNTLPAPKPCSGRGRERSDGRQKRRSVLRGPFPRAGPQRWRIGDRLQQKRQRASSRRLQKRAGALTPAARGSTQRAQTSSPRFSSMRMAQQLWVHQALPLELPTSSCSLWATVCPHGLLVLCTCGSLWKISSWMRAMQTEEQPEQQRSKTCRAERGRVV